MPNAIKYSTTGDTQSLKKGNFFFGVGDVGKGPSSATAYYNGVTPMSGGYTIYYYNVNETSKTSFYTANSDLELITYTNGVSGQNFTTAAQCLDWFATQTNYACVNVNYPPIITNGLVLNLDAGFIPSYPTNGTTWYDVSSGGNNGSLVNGPTFSSANGGSIVFDGSNDRVECGNFSVSYLTVSTWVYRTSSATNQGICRKENGWAISQYNGTLQVAPGTSWAFYNTGYVIPLNTWVNITYTYNGSGGAGSQIVYINGVGIYSTSAGSGPIFSNSNVVRVGYDDNNWFWGGRIANTLIYNRSLTTSEITQNYNAGLARFNTENIVKNNLILDLDASNAVSYPTTGTVWRDLSGYGNAGTLCNGVTWNSNGWMYFDGTQTTNYQVEIPLNRGDLGNTMSVEATFKYDGSSGVSYRPIIGGNDPGSGTEFFLGKNTGNNYFGVQDGNYDGAFVTGYDVFNGDWHHMVYTYNNTVGKLYLDGILRNTGTFSKCNDSEQIYIGAEVQEGYWWSGNISQVRYYTQDLTENQVKQNYYGAPIITDGLVMALDAGNLVSYPGSGTLWKDLTINGANGTLTNGTTFNSSNGGSIVFDGTDDYMVVPTFSNKPTTAITCESWIKPTKPTVSGTIRGGAISSSNSMYLGIIDSVDGGNTFAMHWANQTNNSRVYNWNGIIPNNSWSYLVGTYDGTTARAYLNGVEIWSTPQTGTIPDATYYVGTYGGSVVDGTHNFNGYIPIARIYNRALTPQEISQNYNATKSRFGL